MISELSKQLLYNTIAISISYGTELQLQPKSLIINHGSMYLIYATISLQSTTILYSIRIFCGMT